MTNDPVCVWIFTNKLVVSLLYLFLFVLGLGGWISFACFLFSICVSMLLLLRLGIFYSSWFVDDLFKKKKNVCCWFTCCCFFYKDNKTFCYGNICIRKKTFSLHQITEFVVFKVLCCDEQLLLPMSAPQWLNCYTFCAKKTTNKQPKKHEKFESGMLEVFKVWRDILYSLDGVRFKCLFGLFMWRTVKLVLTLSRWFN